MKNKRLKMFIGIILIIAILGGIGFYIYIKLDENKNAFLEYTPQEEISDKQFRNTIVKLFFKEIGANNLRVESRSIDSKELIENPYLTLVKLLTLGPTDDTLEKTIPEGTVVNNVSLSGDMIVLDLSKEFIENQPNGAELESLTVYSIVNTLTELTEVNSVKILIDGAENSGFKDNAINFSNAFVKK